MTELKLVQICFFCEVVAVPVLATLFSNQLDYAIVIISGLALFLVGISALNHSLQLCRGAIMLYCAGIVLRTDGRIGYMPLLHLTLLNDPSSSNVSSLIMNGLEMLLPAIVHSVGIALNAHVTSILFTSLPATVFSYYFPAHMLLAVFPRMLYNSSITLINHVSSANQAGVANPTLPSMISSPASPKGKDTLLERNRKNWREQTTMQKVSVKWKRGLQLGRGAYGTVHVALNEFTGELMAVKCIIVDVKDKKFQKKLDVLQTELALLRMLEHPNIVQYFFTERIARADGQQGVNIFMEYVPGGSIQQVLQQFGPLSEAVVASYTEQVLLALHYLHTNNVIHRDIKASNILLTTDGECKVADFGAASVLEGIQSQAKSIAGSPLWMPPEVLQGLAFDSKADVWSLGCTVLEMLTAKTPFSHLGLQNPMEVLNHILTAQSDDALLQLEAFPIPLSAPCQSFVRCCMCKDPGNRKSCDDLLKHQFISGVEGIRPFVGERRPGSRSSNKSTEFKMEMSLWEPPSTSPEPTTGFSAVGGQRSFGSTESSTHSDTNNLNNGSRPNSSASSRASARMSAKDFEREERRRMAASQRDCLVRSSLTGNDLMISSSQVLVATPRKAAKRGAETTEDVELNRILGDDVEEEEV